MLIAGEASGDMLAAELVGALREEITGRDVAYSGDSQPLSTGLEPRFFGAGGPRMQAAGVQLAFDLTQHSIIGVPGLKDILKGRRIFRQLVQLAIERQPDVIVGVDYNYFNLQFAHAICKYTRSHRDWFHAWQPKLVKFISPQVWASRERRAYQIARDFDLLLSIFPFEQDWYEERVPNLRVEFVGHPMVDRYTTFDGSTPETKTMSKPTVLLLPGSRAAELKRHLPVMLAVAQAIKAESDVAFKMVLPNAELLTLAAQITGAKRMRQLGDVSELELDPPIRVYLGNLAGALTGADLAIASTGTVTMECAFFGVPAVTLYKTSWSTYEIGKRIVKVKSLTMPNLLADEEVFPEFIQHEATARNISKAALDLLRDDARRAAIKKRLKEIVATLGKPGATRRAATAIADLLQ